MRNQTLYVVTLAVVATLGLAGCKEERPAISLDEARQVTAHFQGQQAANRMVAPPRTITDILKVLEETKKSDPNQFEATRRTAETEPPAGKTGVELARFYRDRGIARFDLDSTADAIEDLKMAINLFNKKETVTLADGKVRLETEISLFNNPEIKYTAQTLNELARAQQAIGLTYESLQSRLLLMEIIKKYANYLSGLLLANYASLANLYVNRGDIAKAEEYADSGTQKLTELLMKSGDPRAGDSVRVYGISWRASDAAGRGNVAHARGNLAASESAFREAIENFATASTLLKDFERLGAPVPPLLFYRLEALCNASLALVLTDMGRLVEAELAARRGLTLALSRFGLYNDETAVTIGTFARVLVAQGRFEESLLMGRAAEDVLVKIGHKPTSRRLASVRRNTAMVYSIVGNKTEALRLYDQLAADLGSNPQTYREMFSKALEYGENLLQAGRTAEAETLFRLITDDYRKQVGENNRRFAEASGHLAAVLAAKGARQEALTLFREAVPILLSASREVSDEGGSIRRDRYQLFVFEHYISLLSDIAGTPLAAQAGDAAAIAFELADALRNKSVQTALAASSARASASDPDLADLVRREQDALRQIGALNGLLIGALSTPPSQQDAQALKQLRTDIDRLRSARTTIREEIKRRFPSYTDLMDLRPSTLVEARAQLRPGEALLATYIAEDRTYVWAMRAKGALAFAAAPLGRKAIAEEVTGLRKALDPQAAALGDIPAFDVAGANRLFAGLMEPVSAGWKGARELLVVPHGPLGQLPFGVLVTKPATLAADREGEVLFASYRAVPFLVREMAITQLPSVSSLAALRRLPPGDPSRKAFIGFGDPWFNTEQAAEASREAAPTQIAMRGAGTALATRAVPLVRRNAPSTNTVDSAEIGLLPRLPDTADEVRSIAQALKADPARDVITGRAANEEAVTTMPLADRRVVMFATHGLVPGDLNGLTQPALALSAPQVTGLAGDGLLTLDEIVGLKLNADWVVLSACNTAAGDGAGAEAVSGLGRGFFYAGTRAVLVTNWPVETSSARELTTDLFRRQADNHLLGRSEALRQAMVALIEGAGYVDPASKRPVFSYAHPIFWAPFSLVGDGGGGPGA